MSRFPIIERIKFDMAVEEAKTLGECAKKGGRGFGSAFNKMLRHTGGNPPWLRKPRRSKGRKP